MAGYVDNLLQSLVSLSLLKCRRLISQFDYTLYENEWSLGDAITHRRVVTINNIQSEFCPGREVVE